MLYVDESVTNTRSEAKLIVISLEVHSYKHALKFTFKTSNNKAEYKTLLVGMEICNTLGDGYLKGFL